jgi:hypothetical protein
VGQQFTCVGYETGGYTGAVRGLFAFVPPFASTGYQFDVVFVVLRQGAREDVRRK